ncbi:hypothetical protein JAO76_05635 [Pontibacter sp. BT310]|jgi:hypothetical protein|uniref:Phosphoribosylpyrophosphate synthetase n=1 Tax=Pontibacter populi TaxID=890055 RepID=A0ABS6X930_9BACT|nr:MULTISPECIES: hypothetical protein [Pontibacter]MBJ6117660.1 hypothetical protein [Pontibacter sp. BT310]MBR0570086.1 hypothetical protein [Microvirga sp. STS03]MBW3364512.1 hypothetical protein [Pontibacter populi]
MQDKVEERSLVNVLNRLHKDGYKCDFKVSGEGKLCTMENQDEFTPDQVRIVDFYRFEGESNPDDMSILYAVETSNGLKGTISNSYGPYADTGVDNFLKQVEDLGKNLDKRDK